MFLLIIILSFPKYIIGGYYWSDIFIGFEGYSLYWGIQNDIPIDKIYDIEKNFGILNDSFVIKNNNVIGISYVGFDFTVLGIGSDYGSFSINVNSKISIGLDIINFTIFGYKVMPSIYAGTDINYYFSDNAENYINDSIDLTLGDNISLELIYGLNSIIEPINKDKKFIIIPKFFPWPLLIGVEVLF